MGFLVSRKIGPRSRTTLSVMVLSLLLALILALVRASLPAILHERHAIVPGAGPAHAQATALFVDSEQALTAVGADGNWSNDVALGDLDNDGDQDALVAQGSGGNAESNVIWLNDGTGTFTQGALMGAGESTSVALGDIDNDADLDAYVANSGSDEVWLNQGGIQEGNTGTFTRVQTIEDAQSNEVVLADLNNDTLLDAVVAGSNLIIYWNTGTGGFDSTTPTSIPMSGIGAGIALVVADLDNDTRPDIVLGGEGTTGPFASPTRVFWNNGESPRPTFAPGPTLPTAGSNNGVAIAQLDTGTTSDVYVASSQSNTVWFNNGDRTFTAGPGHGSTNHTGVALGDLDGDDDVDAFLTSRTGPPGSFESPNEVWLSDGSGGFTLAADDLGNGTSFAVALGDLDEDGDLDAFVANSGPNRVWRNTSTTSTATTEDWRTTSLDVRGRVGLRPSMAVDTRGSAHIAYYDQQDGKSDGRLKYSYFDGFRWQTEIVANGANLGGSSALVLAGSADPLIAYNRTGENSTVNLARRSAGTWTSETVSREGLPSESLDLVLRDGVVHIVYYDGSARQLLHTTLRFGNWFTSVVDTGGVGEHAALAVAPDNTLAVSYYDRSNGDLKYATWNETSRNWSSETVDTAGNVGEWTDLKFDPRNRPHMSYLATRNQGLQSTVKHAFKDGSDWQLSEIGDDTGSLVNGTSLAIDRGDIPTGGSTEPLPIISYDSSDGLRLLRKTEDDTWQNISVDQGDLGGGNVLIRDGNGHEHIAYYDRRYHDLKYAYQGPAWQFRTVTTDGAAPALALRESQPQIVYSRPDSQSTIRYQVGRNHVWSDEQVAVGGGDQQSSLLLRENGERWLAYYQQSTRRLFFAEYRNEQWEPAEIVQLPAGESLRAGGQLRLLQRNNQPYIAYMVDTGSQWELRLSYRNGSSWQTSSHMPARSPGLAPEWDAVATSQGRIAVSYYHPDAGTVRLASWDGITWSDERIVGTDTDDVGSQHGLATVLEVTGVSQVEDVLALAYYDRSNQELRYAISSNQWQPRSLVAVTGPLADLDLALAYNSRALPYIIYSLENDRSLRLSYSPDTFQTVETSTVVEDDAGAPTRLSIQFDNQPRIAYETAEQQIVYAFPTVWNETAPAPAYSAFTTTGTTVNYPSCIDISYQPNSRSLAQAVPELAAIQTPFLPDSALLPALNRLFARTEGGQHYRNLFFTHAGEGATIVWRDRALLYAQYRTIQNFTPGIEALVEGRGDEVIITQEMIDNARDMWERLAAAGSPAFTQAINTELERSNNLQDFVGLTFDEWALAIGVQPPERSVYLPLVRQ